MFNVNHSDVGISYSCQILLLYGAKTNKTLVYYCEQSII